MTELERLTRLFQDILDMARIDAEAIRIERQWVTAADVVDAALAHVRHARRGTRAARGGGRGDGGRDRSAPDVGGAVARHRERRALLAGRPADSWCGPRGRRTACASR